MLFQQEMASYGIVPRRSDKKSDIPMGVREHRRRSYDPMIHSYDQRLLYKQQQQQQHSSAHMSMMNLGSTSLSQQDYHRLGLSMMDGEGFPVPPLHQNPCHQLQQQPHPPPSVVVSSPFFETGSDSGSPTEDIDFMLDSCQPPTQAMGMITSQFAPSSQHQLSQELLLDYYEHPDMLSLRTLTQGEDATMTPMYGMGLEMSQEVEAPYQREMILHPPCSQPHSSPPQANKLGKGRYRMSLNDLSVITSTNTPTSSTLGESQFLSHSMHTLHEEPPLRNRPEGMQRMAAVTATMSRLKAPPHHRSFGALNSMAGELQLSAQGPPGLAGTVAARLAAPIGPVQPSSTQIQGRPMQGYAPQSQQRPPQQQAQIQQQALPPMQQALPQPQQQAPPTQQQAPHTQQQALLTQQQAPLTQKLALLTQQPAPPPPNSNQTVPTSQQQQAVNEDAQQEQSSQRVSLTQPNESTQQNKQEQQGRLRGSGR